VPEIHNDELFDHADILEISGNRLSSVCHKNGENYAER
jgi:hypothetical protein